MHKKQTLSDIQPVWPSWPIPILIKKFLLDPFEPIEIEHIQK